MGGNGAGATGNQVGVDLLQDNVLQGNHVTLQILDNLGGASGNQATVPGGPGTPTVVPATVTPAPEVGPKAAFPTLAAGVAVIFVLIVIGSIVFVFARKKG